MYYLGHHVGMGKVSPGSLCGYEQCITWSIVRVWAMHYLVYCVGIGSELPGPLRGYGQRLPDVLSLY